MALNADGVIYVCASFVFFMFVYKYAAPRVLGWLSKEYSSLPAEKKVCVNDSLMSFTHSTIVGTMALYLFLFSDVITPTVIRLEVTLLKLVGCIIVGYTAADTVVLAANHTSDVSHWSMFVHHVICLYTGHAAAATGELPYYQLLWTMMELANPFINLRVILKDLGQKSSVLYSFNGLALMLMFFLTRVATIPLFWYHATPLYQSAGFSKVTFSMKVVSYVLSPAMHVLNCFWFYKIYQGVLKHFFGKTHKKENRHSFMSSINPQQYTFED